MAKLIQRPWRAYPKLPPNPPPPPPGAGQKQPGAQAPGQSQPSRAYQLQSTGAPGPAPNGLSAQRTPAPPKEATLKQVLKMLKEGDQSGKAKAMPIPQTLPSGIKPGHRGPESGRATNKIQVFTPAMAEALRIRRLQAEFARIVGALAEDLVGQPITGDDEWDVPALLDRQITKRSLASCRQSREKEALVLILDNSGSCADMAEFYSELAKVAAKTGDVEVYLGPNAHLERRYTAKAGWQSTGWSSATARDWAKALTHRVILFFGDTDGQNQIHDWSRSNQLYWFNCTGGGENRQQIEDHMEYLFGRYKRAEQPFQGTHWLCFTEQDLFRLAKRIRPRGGGR